jgi:putative MFS transporter
LTPDRNSQQAALLLARIERLPISAWHVKACLVMGAATFFDALDVLSIAYVLPVLVGAWKLTPQQIGLLISAGFVGQIGGALLFGALAGRIGRLRAAAYAMGLFSLMSFFAAASWSVSALLVFRTIQGIGLGGEVPIAAAYINEVLTAKKRGRTFLLYQLIFPLGLVGASLVGFWLVPRFGWRSMFLIGGAPALLAVFVQRILPESPRWLVSKGRMDEAELVVVSMERAASRNGAVSLPPVPAIEISSQPPQQTAWTELFRGIYRRRTLIVWGLWISTYFVTYGINTWLPTIYRTVYKLSVADALWNGVLTNIAGVAGAFLCAMAVDRLGRKPWFIAAFLLGGVPLFVLCLLGAKSPGPVILLASTSFLFITSNSMLVYLYTPEIYPTRLRTLGTGAASAWLRVASAAGPLVVGPILASYGVAGVFLLFGLIAVSGVGFALGVTETRGRRLEDISP